MASRFKNYARLGVGWFFVIVCLYVLSAGPVLKLIQKKSISPHTAEIYRPLAVLNHIPLLDEVWGWYVYVAWSLPAVEIPDAYLHDYP